MAIDITPAEHIETPDTQEPRRKPMLSLLEVSLVVLLTGVIASAVTMQFANAFGETEQLKFCSQLHGHLAAMENFHRDTGAYPPDAGTGHIPTGLDKYLDVQAWKQPTPIGGSWDIEYNVSGVTSAVGVHFDGIVAAPPDEDMTRIDEILDDGNLETGAFRKLDESRFYYIVLE